jgi:hypothetical protein
MLNGSGPHMRRSAFLVHSRLFAGLTIPRIQDISFLKRASIITLLSCDLIAFNESRVYRFSVPLLSVAGQRLVLNLKRLKTRTYATHDLSREVDRQLEGFAEPDCSIALDDMGESGQEASGLGNPSRS